MPLGPEPAPGLVQVAVHRVGGDQLLAAAALPRHLQAAALVLGQRVAAVVVVHHPQPLDSAL